MGREVAACRKKRESMGWVTSRIIKVSFIHETNRSKVTGFLLVFYMENI